MLEARLTEEAHAALDESLKGHYRKTDDGSYLLDVGSVDGFELQDVAGLRSALGKEKSNAAKTLKELKVLQASFDGLDPDEARDALKKLEEMGGLEGSEKLQAQLDTAKAALEAKFEKDKKALEAGWVKTTSEYEANEASLTAQLTHEMISSKALQAIAEAKGSPKLLLPVVERHCRVEKDDSGKYIVRVYDEAGNPKITSQPGKSAPMNIGEFVTELAKSKDYAPAFEGTSSSGTGGGRGGQPRISGGKTVLTVEQAASGAHMEDIASGKAILAD